MRPLVAIALLLAVSSGLSPSAGHGQARGVRTRRPGPRASRVALPGELVVRKVERTSLRAARREAPTHVAAVRACVARARAEDPAPLAGLQQINVTVRLDARGRAVAVELSPPPTARGLSACLANALLNWYQPEWCRPRAAVYLGLVLATR